MMRCWIVGNGISLNETPLELLVNEHTFGLNRIHKHYESTIWRPTFYVRKEPDAEDWIDSMVLHVEAGVTCYFPHSMIATAIGHSKPGMYPNVVSVNLNCNHLKMNYYVRGRPEEWHLPLFCRYASVTNLAAQIAVQLGHYDEICFVGMDLGYDREMSHFDPFYGEFNEMPRDEREATEIHMHEIIKKECDERGIKVWNCTVGGDLEVYPRKTIQEVLDVS